MNTATKPRPLRLRKVAELTGLNVRTLQELASKGRLPGAFRFGSLWLVNEDMLLKAMTPAANEQAPCEA